MPIMKTDLSHLPPEVQEALRGIAEQIREAVPTEMIILFGSYARGDWVFDRYTEDGVFYEYISDYDILVVGPPLGDDDGAQKRDMKVEIQIGKALPKNSKASVIVHDIKYLNSRLEEGHYFFTDVVNEGVLLHDSGNYTLAKARDLSNAERKKIAEDDFEEWFKSATMFLSVGFESYMRAGELKLAAFELHQATERFYTAILLVHTGYRPKTHDLAKLDACSATQVPEVIRVFPRVTKEETKRFERLKNAYIGARYKKSYEITREDLEYLGSRVGELRSLAETACRAKIESFGEK
jgi:HEPN domain-containing protein/predicted nucleotidyltransferase